LVTLVKFSSTRAFWPLSDIHERRVKPAPSVVDQHVDSAEGVNHIGDEGDDGRPVAHIEDAGNGPPPDAFDGRDGGRQARLVAIAHGEVGSTGGEGQRDGLADPAGRARDNGHASVERHLLRGNGHRVSSVFLASSHNLTARQPTG
jgi:hypothetical protein